QDEIIIARLTLRRPPRRRYVTFVSQQGTHADDAPRTAPRLPARDQGPPRRRPAAPRPGRLPAGPRRPARRVRASAGEARPPPRDRPRGRRAVPPRATAAVPPRPRLAGPAR